MLHTGKCDVSTHPRKDHEPILLDFSLCFLFDLNLATSYHILLIYKENEEPHQWTTSVLHAQAPHPSNPTVHKQCRPNLMYLTKIKVSPALYVHMP